MLIVVVLIGFAVNRIRNPSDNDKSVIGSVVGAATGQGDKPAQDQNAKQLAAAMDPFASDSPAAAVDSIAAETVSKTYTFLHRQPPEGLSTAGETLRISVIVDSFTRTAHVTGNPVEVSEFMRYLNTIDQLGGSCAVQTWAVFVDRKIQRGWDLVAAINAVVPTTTASIGDGAFTLDLGADKIGLALTMIADGSSVEVLQRPHVRLEHGNESRIESIQEVPVPTTTTSQGFAQTSISYRKVGLQLGVTPYFLASDRVRLSVSQSNGLIGQNVVIDGNQVPVIQSQSVTTTATLDVGQTVILGGVSTIRETVARGLLRNTKELSEGALYVILSTYYDVPKAIPVQDPRLPSTFPVVPLSDQAIPATDWIDGGILPSRNSPTSLPLPTK